MVWSLAVPSPGNFLLIISICINSTYSSNHPIWKLIEINKHKLITFIFLHHRSYYNFSSPSDFPWLPFHLHLNRPFLIIFFTPLLPSLFSCLSFLFMAFRSFWLCCWLLGSICSFWNWRRLASLDIFIIGNYPSSNLTTSSFGELTQSVFLLNIDLLWLQLLFDVPLRCLHPWLIISCQL